MKNITEEQWNEVITWLNKFNLPKLNKNIWRDFSDGVLVAHLLKKLYPKYVEIHNYPPRNSTALKIDNWKTLNRKVLKKLNLTLSNDVITNLAKCIPGTIEKILYEIMVYFREEQNRQNAENQNEKMDEDGDIMTVIVTKRIGDGLIKIPQKMILYSCYEKVVNESLEQCKTIDLLSQKIVHLENLLKLKSQHIDDLCSSLSNHSSAKQPLLDQLYFPNSYLKN